MDPSPGPPPGVDSQVLDPVDVRLSTIVAARFQGARTRRWTRGMLATFHELAERGQAHFYNPSYAIILPRLRLVASDGPHSSPFNLPTAPSPKRRRRQCRYRSRYRTVLLRPPPSEFGGYRPRRGVHLSFEDGRASKVARARHFDEPVTIKSLPPTQKAMPSASCLHRHHRCRRSILPPTQDGRSTKAARSAFFDKAMQQS